MRTTCDRGDCPNTPTMGVRTTAPAALRTLVYWDIEDAPKTASLYCHEHGPQLLLELGQTLGRKQGD